MQLCRFVGAHRQRVGTPAAVGVGAGERDHRAPGQAFEQIRAGILATAQDLPRQHRRGQEGHGQQRAAEFLGDDGQFGEPAARTAACLGDPQPGQAHLDTEQPPRALVEAVGRVETRARRRGASAPDGEITYRRTQRVEFARIGPGVGHVRVLSSGSRSGSVTRRGR